MIHSAVERGKERAESAATGVIAIERGSQTHVNDVRMDGRSGSVLNAGDERGKRAGTGVFQDFYGHEFRIRSDSLRANAVDGSGDDARDMRCVAEFAV